MGRQTVTIPCLALLVCLLLQSVSGTAWAQTGKLAGTVTEADTGEPIPGATVVLQGTNLGTSTDSEGRYTIIGLSPDLYDVRFSFVGFATQVFEGIRVTSDRTTTVDAELSPEVIEGDEVLIEAARPVVDVNQTTSRAMVTGEEMDRLPVTSLRDVIDRTSNSYKGFLRGSRRYEAKTVLEGIDITDAFYELTPTSNNAGGYGGLVYNNTNRADKTDASLFTLSPELISEVTVNTGATDASYTSGSGGVVAVTLQEGRGPITGSITARVSPQINVPGPDSLTFYPDDQVQDYMDLRDQLLSDPDTQDRGELFDWTENRYEFANDPEVDFRASAGGAITDNWNFIAGGQWFQTNGFQPNNFTKRIGGTLKTSYTVSENSRITALGIVEDRGLWGGWNNRNYHDFWRYYLEGVAQDDGASYLGSLQWRQVLSANSFVSAQAYRTMKRTRYGYVDDDGNGFTDPGEDGDFLDFTDPDVIDQYIGVGEEGKMFATNIANAYADITGISEPGGTRLRTAQPLPYSEDVTSTLNGLRLDYTSQVTFNHLIQAGVDVKLRQFDYDQVYGIDTDGAKLNGAVEPFVHNDWVRNPWEIALHVSDRMEYAGLVVNLGLRAEFVNRDMDEIVDHFYPFVRDTVQVDGRPLARNFFNRGESVPTDLFLNPRIGVSHPIGSSAAMYFSYARNQQLPPFTQLYEWYDGNHSNNVFFQYQDPNQDPITSNNYELGLQWEFSAGWGADVNAYMRSIDNYGRVGFTATNRNPEDEPTLVGARHVFSTSFGYADARGIELVLRRAPLDIAPDFNLGVTASYTYSSVEQADPVAGSPSFADNDPDNPMTQLPFDVADDLTHFPLNVRGGSSTLTGGYDRRHRVVLRSVAALPYDISVGLTGSLESGFLYRKQIDADPRDRELLTGPTNHQIDLRLEKRFFFFERSGVDVFVDIINLLDHDNIIAFNSNPQSDEPEIFERTGSPGSRLIQRDGSALYGVARNVYFGARLRF